MLSKELKEKIWRLYLYFFVGFYALFAIILQSDKWYSFEPFVVAIGYTTIIVMSLHFINVHKKIYAILCDFFIQLKWSSQMLNLVINHHILLTFLLAASFSIEDTAVLFIVITVITLIIVHIIILFLQSKNVPGDNLNVIL